MIAIPLENIKPDEVYPYDLLDEQGAVLVPASQPVSMDLVKWMRDRRVVTVYTKELPSEADQTLSEADSLLSKTSDLEKVEPEEPVDTTSFSDVYESLRSILSPRVKPSTNWYAKNKQAETLESRLHYYPGWDKPSGREMAKEIQKSPSGRDSKYKKELLENYAEVLGDVKEVIDKIAEGTLLSSEIIYHVVNRIIDMFLKDKNLMLNFSLIKSTHEENIYHKHLNVCILAINIGAATGYNKKQIREIGIGALIHDVGMTLVDPEIRYKKGKLSPQELLLIQKHPLDGLFLISKIKNLPESTGYIIFQHHEREDGSGYPRSRKSKLMHRYARIVGLADMFDALTSKRPYREAYKPYDAMLELLGLVKRGKVSADLMRFFIRYASLFPIGSYVKLTNGQLAKVVEPRGENFVSPLVAIINTDPNKAKQKPELIDLSQTPGIEIAEAIPEDEIPGGGLLEGF